MENNKIEHEVALLRTKVHGEMKRSKSAPSLVRCPFNIFRLLHALLEGGFPSGLIAACSFLQYNFGVQIKTHKRFVLISVPEC